MKRFCGKCGKLHDHDYNCTVGKFDKYYKTDMAYKIRNSRKWHKTRDEALARDNHLCVACRLSDNPFYNAYRLEVHHIIRVKDAPNLAYDLNNCITLCQHHHRQAHNGELNLKEILKKCSWYTKPEDTPPTL